jgi:CO dehydrogenase/acetyl-CoA synthase gamma subunit (corrinoid Fe-S protein)
MRAFFIRPVRVNVDNPRAIINFRAGHPIRILHRGKEKSKVYVIGDEVLYRTYTFYVDNSEIGEVTNGK